MRSAPSKMAQGRRVLQFLLAVSCFASSSASAQFTKYNDERLPSPALEKLNRIRSIMENSTTLEGDPIQAYIVPMNDAHQSEYIAERDKRIFYLTNFSGSAGTVIITQKHALLWTDSRYHIQAERQLDLNYWTLMKQGKKDVPTTEKWLLDNLANNSRIGVDPFILSSSTFLQIADSVKPHGHALVPIMTDLVDEIWDERPPVTSNEIYPIAIQFTGQNSSYKINQVLVKLKENNAESTIITALDEVAWLLNLRGSDISYNPVFFSYLIITPTNLHLYLRKGQVSKKVKKHFHEEGLNITLHNYEDIIAGIKSLIQNTTSKILISDDASYAIYKSIPDEKRIQVASIVAKMKAVKNSVEAQGIRNAHIRDGLALVRYLHWLDLSIDTNNITEISGAAKLATFRSEEKYFKGLSFETASAVGANAALAHYDPSEDTDKQITRKEIYLVDSGGQYLDGTTDVTRTMHFGTPTDYEKQCFTRVLKGFIAFVTSVVPTNTPLSYLDNVARRELWQAGLDYGHGTGHGVGAFLNVHEYPPLITSRPSASSPGIMENMFTSDEPGYYEEDKFGIRIEDVVQVIKKANLSEAFGGRGALTFETVTFAPIQTKMIDTNLLTKDEADYINAYHQKVLRVIGRELKKRNLIETYQWLLAETKQIASTR
ncbi:unnamed protein product [Hermetia illucens]|uniref:Uncharacterized protein n=1 Tax=Hermetia illucens TaxID=343691 RepID=A0A7R8V3E1_HERIL|nr:xaa-Pro aminopeptidase ApepP-like [Hermetia illucens]CAD7091432.1 unnamed protein product [Hermetia illucens]